ncbi:MAG TPA: histidine kinase dimerization/phospho-acceptor domain-containing protein, partial [Vicinamibacterales bacterium]|nr:histidine kinase dimerization/phospho-acceptor domain-containing protein [Vicinamibacterales bacterium]
MTAWRRYGLAVVCVALATLAGLGVEQFLRTGRVPASMYLPAVLVATAVAGPGPGVLATVLGPIAGELALQHRHTTLIGMEPELVDLTLFFFVGAGVTILAGRLEAARAEAIDATARAHRHSNELLAAQVRAEGLAREAGQRSRDFATLFETAPIGIAIAEDSACEWIRPNPALAGMLQVEPGENISQTARVPGRVALNITTPEGLTVADHELPIQRAARTGQPVRGVDHDVVRADGTRLSLLEFAAPLFDDAGHPRGAIGAFLDVTRRRRASEAQRFLGDATHLLSGSLNVERTLAHLARLAVPNMADWSQLDMLNDRGVPTRIGQAHRDPRLQQVMESRLGPVAHGDAGPPAPGRLLDIVKDGQSLLLAHATPEAFAALGYSEEQVGVAQRYGLASLMYVPLVVRGRVEGGFAWVRNDRRPRFDAEDVALGEELARRASAAIENARLFQEAQAANRLKDEFVATLSHELRTPLNALLGWIDLVRSGRLDAERQRDALAAIERTARLQEQITNDLVDVSKAVSGKFRLAPRDVDVGHVVRSVGEAFRLAAESKGVRLTVAVAPDLPHAFVDPDRLQQIVFNLVANAVKFTPAGAVDIRARAENGWLELKVCDTGIGIKPALLPYVFDRFRQADGSVTRN